MTRLIKKGSISVILWHGFPSMNLCIHPNILTAKCPGIVFDIFFINECNFDLSGYISVMAGNTPAPSVLHPSGGLKLFLEILIPVPMTQ
jgi:hypothetical protein